METKEKKCYDPILRVGFNYLKATEPLRGQLTFNNHVPRKSWHSFDRSRKEERLSQPRRHPVALNWEALTLKSSALNTRPLLP